MIIEWQKLTSTQAQTVPRSKVVIIALGSTEPHGDLLPLNTDSVIAEKLADRAAEITQGVVAPSIRVGHGNSGDEPGNIDLSQTTLQKVLVELIDSFAQEGFTRFFLLNAHGKNAAIIEKATERFRDTNTEILYKNWWEFAAESVPHAGSAEARMFRACSTIQQETISTDAKKLFTEVSAGLEKLLNKRYT